MKMLTTTLKEIITIKYFESGRTTLLNYLVKTEEDDEPLGYDVILESEGKL